MIEEETAGEDSDHAEETPSSPPCSGQQLSAEQYGMNTPAKAARGASRRGPCEKSEPGAKGVYVLPQDFELQLKHLWEMDMGLIIKTEYIAKDGLPFKDKPTVDGTNFGYLPKMATTSKGSIGSLLASTFEVSVNVSTLRPIRSIHV